MTNSLTVLSDDFNILDGTVFRKEAAEGLFLYIKGKVSYVEFAIFVPVRAVGVLGGLVEFIQKNVVII